MDDDLLGDIKVYLAYENTKNFFTKKYEENKMNDIYPYLRALAQVGNSRQVTLENSNLALNYSAGNAAVQITGTSGHAEYLQVGDIPALIDFLRTIPVSSPKLPATDAPIDASQWQSPKEYSQNALVAKSRREPSQNEKLARSRGRW